MTKGKHMYWTNPITPGQFVVRGDNKVFVCVEVYGQSTQWGHVARGKFT